MVVPQTSIAVNEPEPQTVSLGAGASTVADLVGERSVLTALTDITGYSAFLGLATLLIAYLPWVVGAGLVLSLATLASAIGLLMRLDWARRAFIGLLALAIVANLLGLWFQHEVVQSLVSSTLSRAPLPPQARSARLEEQAA